MKIIVQIFRTRNLILKIESVSLILQSVPHLVISNQIENVCTKKIVGRSMTSNIKTEMVIRPRNNTNNDSTISAFILMEKTSTPQRFKKDFQFLSNEIGMRFGKEITMRTGWLRISMHRITLTIGVVPEIK